MKYLSLLILLVLASCSSDDYVPFDESQAIIGKFQQVASFDEKDPNAQPLPTWDMFPVENGFTIELFENGTFVLTRYECTTGSYFFDDELNNLTLDFDCPIDINGETFTSINEELFQIQEGNYYFSHEFNNRDTKVGLYSRMLRVEE
jgi:hypothetical protein